MAGFQVGEAARIVRGCVFGDSSARFEGVCTDTREETPRRLFVALRGERADGHAYLRIAAEKGCAAALVARLDEALAIPQIQVPDPLQALGLLVAEARARFDVPVVAVTGSVGKTTTKELTGLALSPLGDVLVSPGNFNNEIGLPRTLFSLEERHCACVLEMGMRGPGQIAELAAMAKPRVGIVTNIGVSHIELLGSREAIARAKAELVEALPADGCAILPADDAFFPFLHERAVCEVRTFGERGTPDYAAEILPGSPITRFRVNGVLAQLSAPGRRLARNAAAACAAAEFLGVPIEQALAAIETYAATPGRMRTVEAPGGILVLDDTYNAAPDSMQAALDTAAERAKLEGRRSVAILGEMRELGAFGPELHAQVGAAAAAAGISWLVAVGAATQPLREAFDRFAASGKSVACADTEEACRLAFGIVLPGDVVLVKGSRAMQMERIVETLARGGGSPPVTEPNP